MMRNLAAITLVFASLALSCKTSEGKSPEPADSKTPAAKTETAALPDPKASAPAIVPDHIVHYREEQMGTVVDLTIWSNDEVAAAKAAEAVFAEFKRVDALMSSWLDDSAVARINKNAGGAPVVVDPEVMKLAVRAQEAAKQSGGAFDISVGAFRGLWKFDEDLDGSIPAAAEVAKRAKLVDYRKIQLSPNKSSIKLMRKGMRITLGGVAKGYAVDQSVAIMRGLGFTNFILQAGGDLYASGSKGERAWRVGIRDPRGERAASFAMAEIRDATFSTSGDYERSLVFKGKRYHHLLDPATGNPADKSRSVTVKAADALTADIWSTALFIMGHEKGLKLVESRDDLEAVFVDASNQLHISSGLKDVVRVLRPPTDGV